MRTMSLQSSRSWCFLKLEAVRTFQALPMCEAFWSAGFTQEVVVMPPFLPEPLQYQVHPLYQHAPL